MAISKIKTNSIANDAITSDKLATGGIATVDMADGSVTSLKILDGGIATVDIANNAITTAKLDTAGISATFAAGAVGTPSITTAGDTNTGIYFPAADTIAFAEGGVESMRIDSSGQVGIGTTSPSYPLDVLSNSSAVGVSIRGRSADNVSLYNFTSNNGATQYGYVLGSLAELRLAQNGANYITAYTNGAERVRIDSSGNVGIGTSSPDGLLDVDAGVGNAAVYIQSTNASRLFIKGNSYSWNIASNYYVAGALTFTNSGGTTTTTMLDNGNVGIGTSSPDALLSVNGIASFGDGAAATPSIANFGDLNTGFWFPAADTIAASTAGTERMRIDSSGNVGIGTSSPTYGTLEVAQGSAGVVSVINNTVGAWSFRKVRSDGSNGMGIYDPSGFGAMALYTAGSERLRIDGSGNVGIGTTSPGIKLQVVGNGSFSDTLQVFNTPSTSAQGILFRNTFNVGGSIFSMGAATTNDLILFVGGSGTQGGITGNGAGIVYTSASDYRLKENVAPMTGALAKVSQLKPCTYTWKFDGSDGQGFIAHELQEVFPDAVTGIKDAVETYTDEDGNEQTRIKPQGVDASFLVAALTAAIQELKAEFDEYKRTHP